MSQQFTKGDAVLVVPDEGLDTPREARGKTGRITGYIRDDAGKVVEYWVTMPGVQSFNAAPYHLIPVPQVRRIDQPEVMTVMLLNLDPDLRENVFDIRNNVPELSELSITTTLLVLANLGYDELKANPRLLKGSGIREVVQK